MKLNEIAEEFGSIKNQIRQLALTDAKVAKEILTKMNNLKDLTILIKTFSPKYSEMC
jgi:hypothetical protein